MQPFQMSLFSRSSVNDFLDLHTETKCTFVNSFWPHLQLSAQDFVVEEYAAFFGYVGRALQVLHPHAQRFAAQDLDSLLSDVRDIQANRDVAKNQLVNKIHERYLNTSKTDVARSIELAARLWLGLNVSSPQLSIGPRNGRDSLVNWPEEQSLDEMIATQFTHSNRKTSDNISFDDSFTAVNLRNICRLHIRWTDNLADHLRLEGPRGRRSLTIYRHKISIVNHRDVPGRTFIAPAILDEALRTLDLLFPVGDPKTEAFLAKEKIGFRTMAFAGLPRATAASDFHHWGGHMVALSSLLNGPPETIAQTLLDVRNVTQFATLWVAIFGVFLLTTLFGILTTIYSVKQYNVTVKSYELSVALAC